MGDDRVLSGRRDVVSKASMRWFLGSSNTGVTPSWQHYHHPPSCQPPSPWYTSTSITLIHLNCNASISSASALIFLFMLQKYGLDVGGDFLNLWLYQRCRSYPASSKSQYNSKTGYLAQTSPWSSWLNKVLAAGFPSGWLLIQSLASYLLFFSDWINFSLVLRHWDVFLYRLRTGSVSKWGSPGLHLGTSSLPPMC